MKIGLVLLLPLSFTARADDLAALCADRAAVEHVYYDHRLGTKPPFEQTMPPTLIEKLVRDDLHKEAVLKKVYHGEITPAMLTAEVQRINTTTRAPATLAELKAALSNDPARFARTVARPILVERLLRDRFENDDALHAAQRRAAETARAELLAAKQRGCAVTNLLALLQQGRSNEVSEVTWQLGPPPPEASTPGADGIEIKKRFGPNARIISPPPKGEGGPKFYFEDLPPELQRVLRVQLRQADDVSAVIETPGGFLLYLCKEKTAAVLTVVTLSIPKRTYEQWLAEQNETNL